MSKINKKQIQDGSVDSSIVEDDSLTTDDLKDGSILNEDISDLAGIELHKLDTTDAEIGNGIVFDGTDWVPGTIVADTGSVDAAGATMNADTDVSGNSWVLDEDNMASDSDVKVPTQQSVKAYVDAFVPGSATTTSPGIVELATDGEVAANVVVQGNDSRLSNARTPTAHASTHVGGTDAIQPATASQSGLATATQITKLDGIEALADVTDAVNVDAAGATMNTDTDVSGNSWVLDEDNMVSNSAIKVPTQQSVKAYVDAYSPSNATTTSAGIVELAINGENAANVVVQGNDSRLSNARTPTAHASSHTDGTDDIQDATVSQKGLATVAQITKLNGIEAFADVTDSANVDAAGATMNTDTNVSGNAWVLDEDSMVSNSATKVPTQQSVKAYVDASVVGLYDLRGGYNANTNTPDLDITPSGVMKGDAYTVTVTGLFFTANVAPGDVLIAGQDNPTQLSHWVLVSRSLDVATTASPGIVELATDGENAANVVVQGNDSRLSNARTPTAHASSHINGADDIQDATASQKGLATATQIAKLNGIEAYADVTDAANVDAAGATMNTDTNVSGNAWVLDEDNMISNSATKVPTQQSVKAYIDASVTGLYDLQGGYDASSNTPDLDVSPSGILKGATYTVSVAGTFYTQSVVPGDMLIANQDNPTQLSHWTVVSNSASAATTTSPGIVELATDGEVAANVVVQGNDSRLSNARTPEAHASTHVGGVDGIQLATASQNGLATAAQIGKLDGVEALADVTDAANVDAAGATMNTDSNVAGNSWVLDEDNMVSNSAAKVPTQQSVKAYVDAATALATTTTLGVVELANDGENAANVVVQGNDSRLSNARTPTAHASTHVGGTDAIQLATASQNGLATATQITKLDGIEALADVTDTANVDAAGATMNTDANVSGNSWVLDEDNMVSNSATKLPTQQSVKAYVDGLTVAATTTALGRVELATDGEVAANVVVQGNDSRLSNARIPLAHASTHVGGTDAIQLATAAQNGLATAAQIGKLDGIEASADVTDTANVDAAGATMNTDTDVSANGWVLNEGTLTSNSATKVPTQQSIKTYVDNLSITRMTDVDTTTTAPVVGDVLEWNGSLWVPTGPKPRVRQDTRTTLGSTGNLIANPATYRTWTITNLPAGDYKFEWFYVWAYSAASSDFYARVDAAGTTMVEHRQEPKDAGTDQRNPECGFGYVNFATTANRTFTIYYGVESSGQTASIHRSVMTLSPVQLI